MINYTLRLQSIQKKLSNIQKNRTVYFCIDEPAPSYKCIRGRGEVKIYEI